MVILIESIRVLIIKKDQIILRIIQSDVVSHKGYFDAGPFKYPLKKYNLNKDIGFCKIKRK